MSLARFTALDGLWVALSIFLVAVGLGLVYFLVRLGSTVGRAGTLIRGIQNDALPVVRKVEGAVERVNVQLDKVDQITDSAVDAVEGLDTAVRAVTSVITRPAQKLSALAAGIAHGGAAFRTRRDPREAYEAGREAAVRREQDIEEELQR